MLPALEGHPLEDIEIDLPMEETSEKDTAKNFLIGGYIQSRNQLRVNDISHPISIRQRLWLDCYIGKGKIRGFINGYFDFDPAVRDWTKDTSELLFVELNEAYVTVDTERMDLILGKKMMRWGTGDGVNPMDLINPWDYRDPIATARADMRLPIYLGDIIFLLGPVTLEGVLIPKPEVNKLSLPGSPWEPKGLRELRKAATSGEIVLAGEKKPSFKLKNMEFAFRFSTFLKGFDLAFIYYNGYMDNPVFYRDYLEDGRMQFTPKYIRYDAYGFNFAKGFGRGTTRGEFSIKPVIPFSIDPNDPSYKKDNDGLISRNLYQGIIGIDYTFFTNLYVNFQFFFDVIEDGKEMLAQKRITHGITFDISNKFLEDNLTAGFRGMYFTSSEGLAAEIFSEYKIGDNWQVDMGYMSFSGPEGTRLGQYKENDLFYFNVKYSF